MKLALSSIPVDIRAVVFPSLVVLGAVRLIARPDDMHHATLSPGGGDSSVVAAVEDGLDRVPGSELVQDLLEYLSWLQEHPLDLNTATEADLLRIPGVSAADAAAIQHYRRTHPPIKDVLELAGIEGLSPSGWTMLRPYVTAAPLRRRLLEWRTRVILPVKSGVEIDTSILGSPSAVYHRVAIAPAQGWQVGMLAVADAGERMRDGFLSGYALYEGQGVLRKCILGDLVDAGGLGLVLGRPIRRWSTANGATPGDLTPHRTSGDQGFLRGGGMTLAVRAWNGEIRLHVIASRTPCAATVDSTDGISSLNTGSAYQTLRSLTRKDAATLTAFGGRIEFLGREKVRCGMSLMDARFDRALHGVGPYSLQGRRFSSLGFDGSYGGGSLRAAMECALTPGGGACAVQVNANAGRHASVNVHILAAGPGFHSILGEGGGYGESLRNTREMGCSMQASPAPGIDIRIDAVQYAKIWRTGIEPFPVNGRTCTCEICFRPAPGVELAAAGGETRTEHAHVVQWEARSGRPILTEVTRKIRCTAAFTRGSALQARFRSESAWFQNPVSGMGEHGSLLLGDLRWNPYRWLAVSGRLVLFQAASYGTRLYSIESPADGTTESVLLLGIGRRWGSGCSLRLHSTLELSFRYSSTTHFAGAGIAETEAQYSARIDIHCDPP